MEVIALLNRGRKAIELIVVKHLEWVFRVHEEGPALMCPYPQCRKRTVGQHHAGIQDDAQQKTRGT